MHKCATSEIPKISRVFRGRSTTFNPDFCLTQAPKMPRSTGELVTILVPKHLGIETETGPLWALANSLPKLLDIENSKSMEVVSPDPTSNIWKPKTLLSAMASLLCLGPCACFRMLQDCLEDGCQIRPQVHLPHLSVIASAGGAER